LTSALGGEAYSALTMEWQLPRDMRSFQRAASVGTLSAHPRRQPLGPPCPLWRRSPTRLDVLIGRPAVRPVSDLMADERTRCAGGCAY
jgi:hypothetical protein